MFAMGFEPTESWSSPTFANPISKLGCLDNKNFYSLWTAISTGIAWRFLFNLDEIWGSSEWPHSFSYFDVFVEETSCLVSVISWLLKSRSTHLRTIFELHAFAIAPKWPSLQTGDLVNVSCLFKCLPVLFFFNPKAYVSVTVDRDHKAAAHFYLSGLPVLHKGS